MSNKNDSLLAMEFLEKGRLESVKIIDVHTHMGDVYGTALSINSMDDCFKVLQRQNVKQIWCAPHPDIFGTDGSNSEILKILNNYKDYTRAYFSFNPNYYNENRSNFDLIISHPSFIGFKFLPEYHRYPVDGDAFKEAFEIADMFHLPILIHTWGGSKYNSPKQIEAVLKRYKNIQVIMGHSAPGELDEAIRLAREYDNAYLDLCDIHRHSGIIDKMAKLSSSEKILFGTDLPWYDPNYCIGSILFSKISDEDKCKIFYKNAQNILANITKKTTEILL